MGARSVLLLIWLTAALTVYLCDLECLLGGPECHAHVAISCTAPVCQLDEAPPLPLDLAAPPPELVGVGLDCPSTRVGWAEPGDGLVGGLFGSSLPARGPPAA